MLNSGAKRRIQLAELHRFPSPLQGNSRFFSCISWASSIDHRIRWLNSVIWWWAIDEVSNRFLMFLTSQIVWRMDRLSENQYVHVLCPRGRCGGNGEQKEESNTQIVRWRMGPTGFNGDLIYKYIYAHMWLNCGSRMRIMYMNISALAWVMWNTNRWKRRVIFFLQRDVAWVSIRSIAIYKLSGRSERHGWLVIDILPERLSNAGHMEGGCQFRPSLHQKGSRVIHEDA